MAFYLTYTFKIMAISYSNLRDLEYLNTSEVYSESTIK